MGTSQRHNPSVKGQPNWGKSSTSLTAAIKNLDKLDSLYAEKDNITENDDNDPNAQANIVLAPVRKSSVEKQRQRADASFRNNVHNSVKRLIKASGGKSIISSGKSRALGHSGFTVLGNFLNIISEIQNSGLDGWLQSKGITLLGQTWEEVTEILADLCSDKVVGLDETAANQALTEIFEQLDALVNDDSTNMEAVLQGCLMDDQLQDIIDKFFGVYIFAHLSQNFNEKLEKKYNQEKVDRYMKEIKEQIISDIKQGANGHKSSNIDWKGEEGRKFISDEFENILTVFDDDED